MALSSVFIAKGVASFGATTAALTPAFPAVGVLADDIAVCVHFADTTSAVTWPGGWTVLTAATTTNWESQVAWKRCTGTEAGTTISLTQATAVVKGAQIYIFRLCIAPGTPYEDYSTATGTSTSATSNATTVSGVDRLAVRITANSDDVTGSTPAGYTSPVADTTTLGNDGALTLDFKVVPSATTVAASTRSITSGAFTVHDFALIPLATAPTYSWSTIDKTADITLSGSNLTATTTAGLFLLVRATLGHHVGKFVVTGTATVIDTVADSWSFGFAAGTLTNSDGAIWYGSNSQGFATYADGDVGFNNASAPGVSVLPFIQGDDVTWAIDFDNRKMWRRINGGNWNGSGTANPATNTGGENIPAVDAGALFLAWGSGHSTDAITLKPTASVPSGFTDLLASTAVNVTTGAQTVSATTQTSGVKVGLAVTGSQNTNATTQTSTTKLLAAVTGAQTTDAATQSATATVTDAPRAVTGSQATNATTQTSGVNVTLAVTGGQTLSAVTQTSAIAPGLAVTTGSQTTQLAATTGAIVLSIPGQATVTGSQTMSEATTAGAIVLTPAVEPPVELPSGGGGGSRAYRRRLRESVERRRAFEEEREKRIAALGVVIERPPLVPAPETVTMIARVLYEPIVRPLEIEPAPQQEIEDDGGEEELLLLLFAA
jgi:hypothetical protein